ncbi:MAG TPA: helix-turn-helix domain-containing protein [Candidatus Acidoferrum sp.]|jgi:putative transcriptional regulator|nr:helix-turn-helix domain-containing protein [Candidatus Acidoferrum sp.]
MKIKLKNKLAECLAARKLKKSQLAYRFGLSRAHVTRLVRGDALPSIGLALRLAKLFGQSVDSIFQLESEDTNTSETISRPCPAADGNHEQCRKPKE